MTPHELHQRLNDMSEPEYEELLARFGGEKRTREQFVREYARDSRHERLLCHLVGLKSEQQKLTEAAQRSAEAAATSAKIAWFTVITSGVAIIVSIVGTLLNGVL